MDVQRLKESFARVAMHGDAVPLFFYSDLFLRHPETRDLFPVSMTAQRERLVHALARIVSDVDNLDHLTVYLLSRSDDLPGYRREDAHIQAVHVLSNAQQTADRYVADAQHYSRQLAEDARRRRDEVLSEAREHAERVLEEAHSAATQAAEGAMTGPVSLTAGERQKLTAELAYLRTFSDVYRTHLRAYLEALLRTVEEWEQAERSSITAARGGLPTDQLP